MHSCKQMHYKVGCFEIISDTLKIDCFAFQLINARSVMYMQSVLMDIANAEPDILEMVMSVSRKVRLISALLLFVKVTFLQIFHVFIDTASNTRIQKVIFQARLCLAYLIFS